MDNLFTVQGYQNDQENKEHTEASTPKETVRYIRERIALQNIARTHRNLYPSTTSALITELSSYLVLSVPHSLAKDVH